MKMAPVLILGGQGYIGSALGQYLQSVAVPVCSVDLCLRGSHGAVPNLCKPYQDLTSTELAEYGVIVLLAGHSSVAACDKSPAEAFANNVTGFVELVHKLSGQKLVYASSISVYVRTDGRLATEAERLPEPVSAYDLHKQTIERYAALAYPNGFGLRLGTVCGPSPNTRTDLLLNSLVWSAVHRGHIQVANCEAHRPLLGIHDLCRAVEAIVRQPVAPGCYNVASVNATVGEVAEYVIGRYRVPSVEVERDNRYDIRVDTAKFRAAAGMRFKDTVPGLVEGLTAFYASGP